jgi:hypothetical protein
MAKSASLPNAKGVERGRREYKMYAFTTAYVTVAIGTHTSRMNSPTAPKDGLPVAGRPRRPPTLGRMAYREDN